MNQVKLREQVVGHGAAVLLSQLVTQPPEGKPVRDWRKRGLLWFWQTVTRCFLQLSMRGVSSSEGAVLNDSTPDNVLGCYLKAGLKKTCCQVKTLLRAGAQTLVWVNNKQTKVKEVWPPPACGWSPAAESHRWNRRIHLQFRLSDIWWMTLMCRSL